jgi:hypothetical protein
MHRNARVHLLVELESFTFSRGIELSFTQKLEDSMHSGYRYAVVGVLLLFAAVGFAQQQRGDIELQFQAMYYTTIGSDYQMGMGNISAKIGPYITDNLQIGIGPTLSIMTSTSATYDYTTRQIKYESDTKTTFGSTAFFVYSFLMKGAKAVPYLGGQYFKSDFSDSDDKGSVGVNAGLKYFFGRKTALDFSGNYLFTLNEGQDGGVLLFAVGLSFLL